MTVHELGDCPGPEEGKVFAGTIDLTPSWRAVAQIIAAGIESGGEARRLSMIELYRMADLADAYVADRELLKDFAEVDSPPRQPRRDQ